MRLSRVELLIHEVPPGQPATFGGETRFVQAQQDVRVVELRVCGGVRAQDVDALIGVAEALGHDEGPVGKLGAQLAGSGTRAGQHRDLREGPADVGDRTRLAAVGADHDGVVPGHADGGECERHGGRGRQNLDFEAAFA